MKRLWAFEGRFKVDISYFAGLKITEEQKWQARTLLGDIKAANPGHVGIISELEDKIKSGAETAVLVVMLLVGMLFGRDNMFT